MRVFLTVAAWIWTGLAAILAVASLSDHMWAAAGLLALSAVASAPALRARVETLAPGNTRHAVVILSALAGMAAIGVTAPTPTGSASVPSAPQAVKKQAADRPAESKAAGDAFARLYRDVLGTASGCDKANSRAADELQRVSKGQASIYDAYSVAKRAQAACESAATDLSAMSVPSEIEGEGRDKSREAVANCRDAYVARQISLNTMLEVLDGDAKPSTVERYKEEASTAQMGVLACVAAMFDAGTKVGVDVSKLKP